MGKTSGTNGGDSKFVSIAKSQKKKQLRIPGLRWEDNIKTNLRKAGCKVKNCVKLVQDRIQLKVSVITVGILDLPVP
jgi:hypothetical protein